MSKTIRELFTQDEWEILCQMNERLCQDLEKLPQELTMEEGSSRESQQQ